MTKKELINALSDYDDGAIVVCMDETGGWDNISSVENDGAGSSIAIVFGGGSPFSDE